MPKAPKVNLKKKGNTHVLNFGCDIKDYWLKVGSKQNSEIRLKRRQFEFLSLLNMGKGGRPPRSFYLYKKCHIVP